MATMSIMANSSTMVAKSTERMAFAGLTTFDCDHHNCPDDSGSRTVNFQSREFADGKDEIAAGEGSPRRDHLRVGQGKTKPTRGAVRWAVTEPRPKTRWEASETL